MRLYYCLTGERSLRFDISDAPTVLNICMKYRYPYSKMVTDGDGFYLFMTLYTAKRLIYRCSQMGICVQVGEARGLPTLFSRYKRRLGLILGGVLALATVVSSGRVVWDIRVVGNEVLGDDEIEAVLSECGFERGTRIDGFDADKTEIAAQLLCDRLAWISVNMKGTVAYVEVREKETPKSETNDRAANIVASRSGRIVEIIAYSGQAAVKAGDEVKAGELLIGGIYGERAPGVLLTRAAGQVKARTFRSFEVRIPLSYEKKVYTDRVNCEKYFIFFSKSIKVFINSGNSGVTCDKIEEEKCLSLFGVRLPFAIRSVRFAEYETVSAQRTVEEAKMLASEELQLTLANELGDARILSRSDVYEVDENDVILRCDIFCIEDIAQVKEFN